MTGRTVTTARQTALVSTLQEAMAYLAGVCDWAHNRDNSGFSSADAYAGHFLANLPPDTWGEAEAVVAYGLAKTYRRQLADADVVDFEALPKPEGWDEEAYREARDTVREAAREARRQAWLAKQKERRAAERAAENYVRMLPGNRVALGFSYNATMVTEAREIRGRMFNRNTKANEYPLSSLLAVLAFADRHEIPVDPEVYPLIEEAERQAALAAAEAEAAAAAEAARPHVVLKGRTVWLRADYSKELNAALKGLNGDYSTWDGKVRAHRVPVFDPQAAQELFARFELRVSPEVADLLAVEEERRRWNFENSVAETGEPIDVPGLSEAITLLPHQHAGVRFILRNTRTIVGDLMGRGKSLTSLAAVAVAGWERLVIMCKPDLTSDWAAKVEQYFPGRHRVYVCEGLIPEDIPADVDTVIVGFAGMVGRAARMDKETGEETAPAMPGWTATLTVWQPTAVILDEGHHGKEQAAKRSQAMEKVAHQVPEGGLVLDLTGTAIVNRPKELLQQLQILDRLSAFGGAGRFLVTYCGAAWNAYGRTFNGASKTEELHRRLREEGLYLRRTDESDLPSFERVTVTIPPEELDQKAMADYAKAEEDVIVFLAAQAQGLAKKYGTSVTSKRVREAMRAKSAEHLVKLNVLRQLAGQAKLPAIIRWVEAQVAAGEQVMVAGHHRPIVDAFAKRFGGLRIQGGQAVASKEADKAAFQAGQKPVISVAIGAGACGHTLTAARLGVQAELCWTPGELDQMSKRIHRIGQTRPVTYTVALAPGTIDDAMWSLLVDKHKVLAAVLDGVESDDLDEKAMAAEVAWELALRGLGESE
jgi:hypothetical protein